MPLDQAEEQQFKEWLQRHHGGVPACPICRGAQEWEQWKIGPFRPEVFDTRGAGPLSLGFQPRQSIVVEMACRQCGYRLTFDGAIIGLVGPAYVHFESLPDSPDPPAGP